MNGCAGQLGVLGLLSAWALWRLATRQWPGGVEAEHGSSGERKHGAVLVGVLAAVVAYYALEFVVWGSYAQAGETARGTGFLLDDLSFQAVLLPVFLTLVVLLGSTDLLGWGELIAARVPARATPSHSWIFLILMLLAACLVIANALHAHPGEALPELLVGAVLAGIVGLLVRLGMGDAGWSDDLRGKLVFVGVILVFAYMTVFSNITGGKKGRRGGGRQRGGGGGGGGGGRGKGEGGGREGGGEEEVGEWEGGGGGRSGGGGRGGGGREGGQ